jgi:hypothetical protein
MTTLRSEGELAAAVRELTSVVQGLQSMIQEDYPKRSEIERDFVSKYGINKRRKQYAILVVIAIVGSYFWTMGTVSYCFLQGQGSVTASKSYCYLLPGYGDVVGYSKTRLETYQNLIKTTEVNRARIEELERQIKSK